MEDINNIISDLKQQIMTAKDISNKYEWSISNIYRIKANIDYYSKKEIKEVNTKLNMHNKRKAIETIKDFDRTSITPYTVQDVMMRINQKIKVLYPRHLIIKLMKEECLLSYKRITSRPKYIDSKILSHARALFCAKFMTSLTSDTLIINIDESIINKSCKANYSWGIKGMEKEWHNQFVTKSISLILALLSNGTWMWLLTNKTIN